jgi:hypothetical protein
MSLFDLFRDVSYVPELQRLADVSGYLKIQANLAEARRQQERMTASRRIEELEGEVAQLTIVLEAMLEKLYESGNLNSETLAAKIIEIDLRDGVADGKITKAKRTAPVKKPAVKEMKLVTKKAEKPPVKFLYTEPQRKTFSKDSNSKRKF